MTDGQSLGDLLNRLRARPVKFNTLALGRPPYWSKQEAVAAAFQEAPLTLVPSGHATGKTFLASGLALHYLCTHKDAVVLCYAPSHTQLRNALWPEIKRAWNRKRLPMPGRVLDGATPGIQIGDKWYLRCLSADGDPERLQGTHAGRLAVLCDESSWDGYDQVLPSVLSQSPERLLLIGNPLRRGIFHRLCTTPRDASRVIPISTLDSPHIQMDRSPFGLADKGMLDLFRQTWGEESLVWRVRILGHWPDDSTEVLLPDAWLERCATPHVPHGDRWLSIDLSAGTGTGDKCVLGVRDQNGIVDHDASASWCYPEDVARRVVAKAGQWQVPPGRVVYDGGGLGYGFGTVLALLGFKGARAYVGAASGGVDGVNHRACSALAFRDRLNPVLHPQPFHIPEPLLSVLRKQSSELRYEVASGGRIKLEEKGQLCARLGHSPDELDCHGIIAWSF